MSVTLIERLQKAHETAAKRAEQAERNLRSSQRAVEREQEDLARCSQEADAILHSIQLHMANKDHADE